MTLLDTSVLVNVERQDAQSVDALAHLLADGDLAVSAVTVHELLRSPKLTPGWRAFWRDLLDAVPVLELDRPAAEAAAEAWAELRARNLKPDVGDVLIAGTASAAGCDVLTADEGFAEMLGARLLRPS